MITLARKDAALIYYIIFNFPSFFRKSLYFFQFFRLIYAAGTWYFVAG